MCNFVEFKQQAYEGVWLHRDESCGCGGCCTEMAKLCLRPTPAAAASPLLPAGFHSSLRFLYFHPQPVRGPHSFHQAFGNWVCRPATLGFPGSLLEIQNLRSYHLHFIKNPRLCILSTVWEGLATEWFFFFSFKFCSKWSKLLMSLYYTWDSALTSWPRVQSTHPQAAGAVGGAYVQKGMIGISTKLHFSWNSFTIEKNIKAFCSLEILIGRNKLPVDILLVNIKETQLY